MCSLATRIFSSRSYLPSRSVQELASCLLRLSAVRPLQRTGSQWRPEVPRSRHKLVMPACTQVSRNARRERKVKDEGKNQAHVHGADKICKNVTRRGTRDEFRPATVVHVRAVRFFTYTAVSFNLMGRGNLSDLQV